MANSNFKIRRVNGTIILEKDNQGIAISQAVDNDIWFTTSEEEQSLELSMYSRNYPEWQTYMVFESLMKSIIGSYILNGDYKDKYSMLPKDFIDLDNNTITWHSDSGMDNILKLSYSEKSIKISISKSKDASSRHTNAVRIRTSGSMYENYYQEFLAFFRLLSNLENRLNSPITKTKPETKETSIQRKLSLFKRMSKNE